MQRRMAQRRAGVSEKHASEKPKNEVPEDRRALGKNMSSSTTRSWSISLLRRQDVVVALRLEQQKGCAFSPPAQPGQRTRPR